MQDGMPAMTLRQTSALARLEWSWWPNRSVNVAATASAARLMRPIASVRPGKRGLRDRSRHKFHQQSEFCRPNLRRDLGAVLLGDRPYIHHQLPDEPPPPKEPPPPEKPPPLPDPEDHPPPDHATDHGWQQPTGAPTTAKAPSRNSNHQRNKITTATVNQLIPSLSLGRSDRCAARFLKSATSPKST